MPQVGQADRAAAGRRQRAGDLDGLVEGRRDTVQQGDVLGFVPQSSGGQDALALRGGGAGSARRPLWTTRGGCGSP
ncbi:hypothetical protein ACFQU7_38395 [Pseudoroseomonas wenyumeiae]